MSSSLPNTTSSRLPFVDQLKGFAIFLVVLGHVYNLSLKPEFSLVPTFISVIHMPVFMFIAGYMFYRKDDAFSWTGYFQEMKRKFRRVFVPFISFVLLVCFYRDWNIVDVMMNNMKYGYWFIYTLFMLYLVYYPFLYVRMGKMTEIVTYIVGSSLGLLVVKYLQMGGVVSLFSLTQFAQYSFPFLLGMWLRKHREVMGYLETSNRVYTFLLVVFSICYYGYIHIEYGTLTASLQSFAFHFVMTGVSGLLFWIGFKNLALSHQLGSCLGWLGKNSLSIYLIHYFFLPSLEKYNTYTDAADSILLFLIAVVMAVFVLSLTSLISIVVAQSAFLSRYLLGVYKKQ